jgi:YbbR domain-containing protein
MTGDRHENWLVRYNVGYKILALCLAFLLWYYVAGQMNPMAKQTYTRPLELRPSTTRLLATTSLPQVTITVCGIRTLVSSLQDRDIHAYVDVSDQTAGVCSLPVKIDVPDNIQVLSIYPRTVRVSLDYWAQKKVPVRAVLQGEPYTGYMTLTPSVTPAQVMVSGPRSLLSGIQSVQAIVPLAGVTTNVTQQVPIQLAQPNDKLQIDPGTVEVVVPVVISGPVKTVPVNADVTGTPGQGKAVTKVVVEPALVDVTGAQDVLNGLTAVSTQPVDISGAVDRVVENVSLVLPSGVSLVSQGPVQVTVEIRAASGSSQTAPPHQ